MNSVAFSNTIWLSAYVLLNHTYIKWLTADFMIAILTKVYWVVYSSGGQPAGHLRQVEHPWFTETVSPLTA
ncbi:hypothetical protein GDO86_006518 [Hymenochirus boettgeri]|uniref:Uncharacterized protein n=1 Tax=Hymenochirus boettgeri TaxID=247094 RepID=A0A8T2J6J4_9PIPI|nr:hypothetical protein GDO86_006518 [Hymenochirus boettgeri]